MKNICLIFLSSFLIAGCAKIPKSDQVFGETLPTYVENNDVDLATIYFSSDKKYESKKGVPFPGEPVICEEEGLLKVDYPETGSAIVKVPSNKLIRLCSRQ